MSELFAEGFEAMLGDFLLDTAERISGLERALLDLDACSETEHARLLRDIRRELHTLKGNAGMMGIAGLQELAHRMEEIVDEHDSALRAAMLLPHVDTLRQLAQALTPAPASEGAVGEVSAEAQGPSSGSVRVAFAVLDGLIDQLAETVILRNRLADAVSARDWDRVAESQTQLTRALNELRDGVMGLRLTPLQMLFASLRRIVHDESARENKEAQLETVGGSTPLDKALLDVANEALGHLVRNAVIHGLETPDERTASHKKRTGTIRVSAHARAEQVRIEVSDDGAGIDPVRLRALAEARGVAVPEDVFGVLFEAGFTTRAQADIGSGRGVGLAAVREAVRRQNGEVVVLSEVGRGTTFRMDLPMSVSITRALLIEADSELYALPVTAIMESRRLQPGDSHVVNGAGVISWRGEVLTLLDLGCHFETTNVMRDNGCVIVIQAGSKCRGLAIDKIHGLQEIVVKVLDRVAGKPRGVAGTTVLGDGRPVLILDPRALVEAEPFIGNAA